MAAPSTLRPVALELMRRAAVSIPRDFKRGIDALTATETSRLSLRVLDEIRTNYAVAEADGRPMCGDTGLPRWYVKVGEHYPIGNGFIQLERLLRRATAEATRTIPLRPNRVHPLTRADHNNNVGVFAPEIDFSFEPDADWIELTTVHKGGLFGSDYRMLFPADGEAGIRKFFLDTFVEFGRRGMACQPAVVGVGIGGCKDTTMRIAKEAACLRPVGDRHPDPRVAALEVELKTLGNRIGMGPMGFVGNSAVVDAHVEIAYTHTGGMPVAMHTFCFASRRATARVSADGDIEYRDDPKWFTDYYRREGL